MEQVERMVEKKNSATTGRYQIGCVTLARAVGISPPDAAGATAELAGIMVGQSFKLAKAIGDDSGDIYGAVGCMAALLILAADCKFDDAMIASIRDAIREAEARA